MLDAPCLAASGFTPRKILSAKMYRTPFRSPARKVGLKELWTLKWYLGFNTAGPWTKAGGVLPEDWPKWMRE